jgi:mannose-1-phosphate guanylyltransferase
MQIVPVVLCGGAGTRLWPVSRRDHAKQHIPLFGGGSPFQRTLQRLAARRDPEAVAFVLPSDHYIRDVAAFADAAARAVAATAEGDLVVFGLVPTGPATGFGYIRPGDPVEGVRRVAAFVEKPDAAQAEALVAEGCLWNSGMFAFGVGAALEEIGRLAPDG